MTCESVNRTTLVDYILCKRCNFKEIGDCKVAIEESVARKPSIVVFGMMLVVRKRQKAKAEERIKL